ncbi:MAG: hypothetical protein AAF738_04310, partial [Bacteroidota bacterium]
MQALHHIYQQRAQQFTDTAEVFAQKYNRYTLVRIAIFLVGIALLILAWTNLPWLGAAGTVAWLYGFYRFILWHQSLKTQETHFKQLAKINANERKVLEHEFSMFEDGAQFVDAGHSYSLDLDIFGPFSLFQYCNRTSTAIGQHRLAQFFRQPAPANTILARQAALQELKDQIDWRQHFQAHGVQTEDENAHLETLKIWLASPNFMLHNAGLKAL